MPPTDPPRVDKPAEHDEPVEARRKMRLDEIRAEWDARLRACFDAPDFNERVDAMMDARGHTKVRPKAGETY